MMRKWKTLWLAGLCALTVLLTVGCSSKTKEALKEAETAIAEAEAASASTKAPEVYDQAKEHLKRGRDYEAYYRNSLAVVEYEAAAADARLAIALAGQEPRPEGCPPCPLCPECPEPVTDGVCCMELSSCNAKERELKNKLNRCQSREPVRTRVIREPCVCDEEPAPAAAEVQELLGTLMVLPPSIIEKGKADYKVKVKYIASRLGRGKGDNAYSILLDVYDVDPPEVEVFSPTADFEPLMAKGGEWTLPVNVPNGTKGPVRMKVSATLMNYATGKEQKLPDYKIVIPDASSCPKCPKAKPKIVTPKAEAAPSGPGWGMAIVLLLIGLAAGIGAGFFAFGRKKGSTI